LYVLFFIEANGKNNIYCWNNISALLYVLYTFSGGLGVFSQVTVTIHPKSGHQVAWQPCSGLTQASYHPVFLPPL